MAMCNLFTDPSNIPAGVTYIRWGRTACPDTEGTQLVYGGAAAGGTPDLSGGFPGGGSEYLCLPNQPEFLNVTSGIQRRRSGVYGAEYESHDTAPAFGSLLHFEAPCAACYSTRSAKIMIPGKVSCPSQWTREYYGYLMSEATQISGQSSYACMDIDAEAIGNIRDLQGAGFYFAEVHCVGINCPPYDEGSELPCVVCTK